MQNSILASLMVSGAKSSGKAGMVRRQETGDSFSGILAEKLQVRVDSGKNAYRPARAINHDRPATTIRKDLRQERGPEAESSFPEGEGYIASGKSVKPELGSSVTETEKTAEKRELIDEIALLLETLFMEPDMALSGWGSVEESNAEGIAAEEMSHPVEALRAMMEGRLDRLQELLNQVRSMEKDTGQGETLALLDEIEALISKIQQNGTGRDSASTQDLTAIIEKDWEALEALTSQLKVQCHEIAQKLRSGQDGTGVQDQAAEIGENPNNSLDPIIEGTDASRDDGKLLSHSKHRDVKADKTMNDDSVKIHGTEAEMTEAMDNNQTLEGHESMHQSQQAARAQLPQDISPSLKTDNVNSYLYDRQMSQNVTNQVTMKIRLMAGENKQELEMHLKPDNLGKLSLKIVHERGEVLARITAENEQVKSILESNMQLLKDALEKSGYSVQSLDVSVGNQNSENRSTHQQGQNNKRSHIEEPVSVLTPSDIRRVSGSRLYDLGIPGVSQQIDLIA